MKKVYFQLFSTTAEYYSINGCFFGCEPYLNDLAGYVVKFAKRVQTDPENVRLFIFESKRQWEEAFNDWRSATLYREMREMGDRI